MPRDPSGRYVYVPNFDSDTISRYAVDAASGVLAPLEAAAAGRFPVAMAFAPV